ncbi:hypothetical protein Tco_0363653 [Tanacetum coccineum]
MDPSLFRAQLFSALCGVVGEPLVDGPYVMDGSLLYTPPVASMEMLHAQTDLIEAMQDFLKKYDSVYLIMKSASLLALREILKSRRCGKEQTQPEYLQELLQNQEEKSITKLLAEERFQKANQALNESQSPQEMRIQDLEIQKQQYKIYELKDKFNGLSIEIWKIIQEAEELRESEARARSQKIIIDDDDDNLGFYAVHPNMIHTPVSQNSDLLESLINRDTSIVYSSKIDPILEEFADELAHIAPIPPEIVEVCVDDDNDYDNDFYDCVDIEEDGGEIDLDISKIVDISLREKLVESYLLIEKINSFRLSPPIPISPIICPSSTIPVVDIDLPLEEADVPSFSDDSMILSEYESFTFDDEPVMAEVNVFDEINTSELSYPGIGENVVLDEEEDTFTFTIRSFLPFVTYPEVLPTSYSTGSEDKVFKPGIFDNVLTRKSSLTLDVFDPLHPPLMDFNVTKAFSGFTFSLLKIFSKKFVEPGIKNATVFRILEASWFNIVEGQSNSYNFHRWSPIFSS